MVQAQNQFQKLHQLEMYQKGSFLSSGQNVILDFGWVRSQKPSGRAGDIPKFLLGEGQHAKINQDLFKDTIEMVDGSLRKTVDAQWDKLEIEYFGDWSGIIGPISKFTWAQRPDGGFDCVTEIISRGSNIFDKALTALQKTPPELKTLYTHYELSATALTSPQLLIHTVRTTLRDLPNTTTFHLDLAQPALVA